MGFGASPKTRGLHFVVMKVTVGDTADPLFYAALRMSIVALIMLPWLKWHKGLMRPVLGVGLAYGALNYAFMFPALGMTTASAAAITIELYVPFSIILSVIVFKDKIGLYKTLGILMAFVGVIIIASAKPDETAGPYFVWGIILMVGAAMCEAVGAVLVAFILALIYSALIVSIVAHSCYYWLLQRLPIYIVSSTGLMTTVIAVIASAVLLGEALTLNLLLGGVITLGGIGLILGGVITLGGIGLILARKNKAAVTPPT